MSNINMKSKRQEQAHELIIRRTIYAGGTGLIPVPIVDAAVLLGVQLSMIRDITNIYEVEFKEQRVKSIISVLVGDIAAVSLLKFIPGIGTLLGGASASVMGAATTYALGKVFVKHFEEGGTFLDFDTVQAESVFKKKLEEGKKVVKSLRKNKNQSVTTNFNYEKEVDKTNLSGNAEQLSLQNKTLNEEILALQKDIEALKQQRKSEHQGKEEILENINIEQIAEEVSTEIDRNNLQIIKGIGPKTAKILQSAGITTLQQLSETTPEILKDILLKTEIKLNLVIPDSWGTQAKIALKGNLETLKQYQKELQ